MSRRRWTFRRFLKRRWRFAGFTLVLMAAALLLLVVQDRGHDPLWTAQPGDVAQLALEPSGDHAYAITQSVHGDGTDYRVHAFNANGHTAWSRAVNASGPPLLAAADDWVAVVTPFPGAKLLAWSADGRVVHQEFLEGSPRTAVADGDRLAIALGGPGNRVLLYDGWNLARTIPFPSPVNTLDLQGDVLAAGTDRGVLRVLREADELLNVTHDLNLRSLHLGAGGLRVVAGGFSRSDGALSGAVLLHDLNTEAAAAPAWRQDTSYGVSLVQLDRDGGRAVALEESIDAALGAPRYRVHLLDATTGDALWSHQTGGIVYRDGVGGKRGGVALSPDGDRVAVATIDGALVMLDTATGKAAWTYASHGATLVTFAEDSAERSASNARLGRSGPYDALLAFDGAREPFVHDLALFAPALLLGIFTTGFGGLAIAYRVERRG